MELKRIGVMSAAKVSAMLGVIVGFIAGLIMTILTLSLGSVISMFGASAALSATPFAMILGFGYFAVILVPIMMGIYGFIGGAISAFFYNVAAKYVGGVQLDLK